MLYWVFKWVLFVPIVRLVFRPTVSGVEYLPTSGPAILASNHISAGDTFVMPSMISRRVTFPAKSELFAGGGPLRRVVAWFLNVVGQLPMDRSGGRASSNSMTAVIEVLRRGQLLGIYPEGTRSPDSRLYRGKTGVARLVLASGVPVIPIGMIDSEAVPSVIPGIPTIRKPQIRFGPPLDFSAYAAAGNDRDVLRHVTDEIMAAIQRLSGQVYVDAYASSVKSALAAGKPMEVVVKERPGAGRPTPPIPAAATPATEVAG